MLAFTIVLFEGSGGLQDRRCMKLDAEETLAKWESRYVRKVLPHSCEKFMVQNCYVTSENKFISRKSTCVAFCKHNAVCVLT